MSFSEELREVEEIGARAWRLALQGNSEAALRKLKKIRGSFFVSESERYIALVEAKILQRRGNMKAAQERIIRSISYLWGIEEGFEILSKGNSGVDQHSKLYYVEILGGLATLGFFTQFTADHIASFHVIANSEAEALRYIDEVANFADPDNRTIITCAASALKSRARKHRGVVQAYPFRLDTEGTRWEQVPEKMN
jgi:hypothetical protein